MAKLQAIKPLAGLKGLGSKAPQADRRKRKRITIDELNRFGAAALSSKDRAELLAEPDKRGAWTKFIDLVDVPRNTVANIIGKMVGVKTDKAPRGWFQKKVWGGDILKKLGVKNNIVRGLVGFGIDYAIDPFTPILQGATTGMRLAKGLPKMLKGGTKALTGTSVAGVAGRAADISEDVVRAVGLTREQMLKLGQVALKRGGGSTKRATKWFNSQINKRLVRRAKGGSGLKGTTEARQFFVKHGEKGRTVLRVPFMEKGIALKGGKRGAQYREMAGKLPGQIAGKLPADVKSTIALTGGAKVGLGKLESIRRPGIEGQKMLAAERPRQAKLLQRMKVKRGPAVQAAKGELATLKAAIGGAEPTKAQAGKLRGLEKFVKSEGINKAALRRSGQARLSAEGRKAYRELRVLERAPGPATKGLAGLKKPLLETIKGGAKAARTEPKQVAKAASAFEQALAPMQEEIQRLRYAPGASPSLQASARGLFGKLRPTAAAPGAGLGARAGVQAGRIKQGMFGPGHSRLGTVFAGATRKYKAGSQVAAARTAHEYAVKLKPIAQRLSAASGKSADEINSGLLKLLDSPDLAKLAPDDQWRPLWVEMQKIAGSDKGAADVLQQYRKLHDTAVAELGARGVVPGTLRDYVPRRPTKEFRKLSDPYTQTTLRDASYSGARRKEVYFAEPGGTVHRALTSDPEKVKRIHAIAASFGEKAQTFDVSLHRYNVDPKIAKRLLPEGLRGKVGQFAETIPEAAGEIARQKVRRLALADITDAVKPLGIRAEALERHGGHFSGYAQVRWERFRDTPAYQTVFRQQIEGMAFPQPVTDMIERFMTVSAQPPVINQVLKWSDATIGAWRAYTLMHPAYTIRNVTQNIIGNLMAGNNVLKVVRASLPNSDLSKAVRAARAGKEVTGTLVLSGRTIPAKQFTDLVMKHNLIGSGIMSQMPDIANKTGRVFRSLPGKVAGGWFSINSGIEDTMKAASLWAALDDGLDLTSALERVARAMPDLTDLTLREKNVARRLFPFYCVPNTHRALTRRGWRPYYRLVPGEDILTYNIEKDMAEWKPILRVNVFEYNGVMMTLNGRMGGYSFTPNHRWPVWSHTTRRGVDVGNVRKVVEGYQLRSSHRIPRSAPFDFSGGDTSVTPREAALVGWAVTDGHMRMRRDTYPEVVIYQKKEVHLDGIRELLGSDARKEYVHPETGTIRFSTSAGLARRLFVLCPTKDDLPELVSRLTKQSAEAMWKAMFDAEGSSHERAGDQFTQNAGPVMVAFQMLTIMLNRTAHTNGRPETGNIKRCYVSKSRQWMKVAGSLGTENYKGVVWCPTTANGTWFMENNGRVIITGNSWMRKNGALQLFHYLPQKPAFIAAPGKIKQAWEQAFSGDDVVPEELRPAWQNAQQAVQVSGDRDKGTVFLSASWLPFQEVVKLGAGAFDIGEAGRLLGESARPGLRLIAEQAAGQEMFRRVPVEKMGIADVPGAIPRGIIGRGPLGSTLAVRPVREAFRVGQVGQAAGTGAAVARGVLGGAFQPVNRVQGLAAETRRLRELAIEIRGKVNRALQVGDESLAADLQRQLFKVLIEMQRMGLPGVPKATQRMLTGAGVQAGAPAFGAQ